MVKLVTAIFSANSGPRMIALSSSVMLLEHHIVKEKEYGMNTMFEEMNRISTPTKLSMRPLFMPPLCFGSSVENNSDPFKGGTNISASSRRIVASEESLGTGCAARKFALLTLSMGHIYVTL